MNKLRAIWAILFCKSYHVYTRKGPEVWLYHNQFLDIHDLDLLMEEIDDMQQEHWDQECAVWEANEILNQ